MESRGKRLMNLALKNASSFVKTSDIVPGRKITIVEEKRATLDEKTGYFVYQSIPEAEVQSCEELMNEPSCSYVGKTTLDEKTGQIITLQDVDITSSELDFSNSSESDYIPEEYGDSSSSEAENSSKILNEFSGNITIKRARKGQGNEASWARNRLKIKRMKGQEYVSVKRKKNEGIVGWETRKQRVMEERCNSEKCALAKKCNSITNEQRKEIFNTFWCLSWKERKSYVISMVNCKETSNKTKGCPTRRMNTLEYSLKVNGERMPVCKTMFCSTLCLGEWSVLNWVKKSNHEIGLPNKTHKPIKRQSKLNVVKVNHAENFLTALPKMPAHYCRQSNSKSYVDVIYTCWKDLYRDFEKHLKVSNTPEKEIPTYKCFLDVVKKLNIGLYRPRKDQCDICYANKNKNVLDQDYETHKMAKERARKEKQDDKEKCKNGEIQMLTLDLQAVQSIPYIPAGAQYFKLKLSVHQFTIYNEHDKSVMCYVWHEGQGGMDSNVFASCLLDYLECLQDKTKQIVIYSDGCSAQNRNVTLPNALQNFTLQHQAEIHQKYLVVGHTQMECDSVHATIERKKKGKELYVPADFVKIIKEARSSSEPYKVKYVDHKFFKDFSALSFVKSIRPGSKKGDPCVVNIRALKYSSVPGIHYKLSFDDDWSLLPQRSSHRQGTSCSSQITSLYSQTIPLNKRKYDDLQALKVLLPEDYHAFYNNLRHE